MNNLVTLVLIALVVLLTWFFSSLLMQEADWAWYARLNKSPSTPESSFISIAWLVIYVLIILAWWWGVMTTTAPILISVLFLVNLVLNLSWTYVFFVLRQPRLAMMLILGMILTLVMLVPYLSIGPLILLSVYFIWLMVAGSLNNYIILSN